MNLKKIILGLIVFMFLLFMGLVGVLAVLFLADVEISPLQDTSPPVFTVLETGTAGNNTYAVFNYRGEGDVTALAYDNPPSKKVVVINDSRAINANRFFDLIDDLRELEKYGYELVVTDETTLGNHIYIIPTGALPSYALFNLEQNTSYGTIIYMGEKDLILSRGIKKQDWYDSLSEYQKGRVVQFDGTLDEFLEGDNHTLVEDILYQKWNQRGNSTIVLSGDGADTIVVKLHNSPYLRLIYEVDDELYGFSDSGPYEFDSQILVPEPAEAFPWERSTLRFPIAKTNGTAILTIKRDGKIVEKEFLRRASDGNIFLKKMQYNEPGEYVMAVTDNDKQIASGLFHVNDLRIELLERHGVSFVFSVTVDGFPVENTDAFVSLGESEKQRFFVSDGQLTVLAKPDAGENIFNVEIFGTTVPYHYMNDQQGFFDIYFTYGLPGLAMVLVVYFGARLSRRPMYSLRFGDSATYVRQEIRVPTDRAVESFERIREDMNLGKSPITPHEFSISLKRYLTNGADVTEGNIEEILKKLVKGGHLEGYRDYYQRRGEGDAKRNALRRMAREKLIESGTTFKDDGQKFVTKDFEIGFFGQKFNKKGIVVVSDRSEIKRIFDSLSGPEKSKLEILRSNGMIRFVPIDQLNDVL